MNNITMYLINSQCKCIGSITVKELQSNPVLSNYKTNLIMSDSTRFWFLDTVLICLTTNPFFIFGCQSFHARKITNKKN